MLVVKVLDGENKDVEMTLHHGKTFSIRADQKVKEGEIVVLTQIENENGESKYFIIDKYRLNYVSYLTFAFFILVIGLSGLKGLGSIAGMLVSIFVIVGFIVPQILSGKDPLLISITGSIVILIVSIYLAHGFSQTTTVAVAATSLTLMLTGFLSVFFC